MQEWIAALKRWAGKWPDMAASYFVAQYGLDPGFAVRAALLYLALHAAGLKPRVTSGFRDPDKQKAMQKAWDSGQRQGLRARPATDSAHTKTSWTGRPGAQAIDMPSANEKLAADIAVALGLRAGYYFKAKDPGHFDALGA